MEDKQCCCGKNKQANESVNNENVNAESSCCSTHSHEESSCCCGGENHVHVEETSCCSSGKKHAHAEESSCCCGSHSNDSEQGGHGEEASCCCSSGSHSSEQGYTEESCCCCGGNHSRSSEQGTCCGGGTNGKKNGLRNQIIILAISLASLVLGYFDWEHIGFMPFYYVNPSWIAIVLCGIPLFKTAFVNLFRKKKITAALLISIATFACIGLAIASYFPNVKEVINSGSGHNHSYLFAAGEVVFLMSLGGLIEEFTVKKTRSGIEKLTKLVPKTATVVTENGDIEKNVKDIRVGDIVLNKEGETISVDGIVVSGSATVDTSSISGEYVPVEVTVGDKVYGGTLNLKGTLKIEVTVPTKEMTIAKMADLVKEASGKKAPIARVADKWSSIIVPCTVLLAVLVGIIAYFALNVSVIESVVRACTVLVVFCPCSLALATPTAISASLGNSANNGVLIKSGGAVEALAQVDVVCVDKTGTLTSAQLKIDKVITFDYCKNCLKKIVASIERNSSHPIAKALSKDVTEYKEVTNLVNRQGVGISATVDGQNVDIVSYTNYKKSHQEVEEAENLVKQGKTVIAVIIDNILKGIIALSDTVKDTSIEAIKMLKDRKIRVIMLTGDNEFSAKAVASECGIDEIKWGLLPEEKLKVIEELKAQGHKVCMLGDGINDAPSLALADVGVAMGALGADIAVETADMAIMNNSLEKIVATIDLAKRTIRKIKVNITIAMGINLVATTLSTFGLIDPMIGAIVHNGTSILVVSNSALLLLNRKKSSKKA